MRIQHLLISCFLFATTLSAQAYDRTFPVSTKRGEMTPTTSQAILVDGKPRTLTVGARIWNQDNAIEMVTALRGSKMAVNYTEMDGDEIDRIWILTADEAKQKLPKPVASPFPLFPPLPAPVSTFK